jgi:hypothetical protein
LLVPGEFVNPQFDHVRASLGRCGNVPLCLREIRNENGDAQVSHEMD